MDLIIPASIIGSLGLFFGVGLAYASKKFEVKVDEKIAMIREALPGANCGACGQTGCDGFAEGVAVGTCAVNGCPVGGTAVTAKIAEIMGVEADAAEEKTARVKCAGSFSKSKAKFAYGGIQDCAAAANLHGGPMACSYGCVGMGSCVRECAFGAIEVVDGVARVNESKCTSCGKCVRVCPKRIIAIVPKCAETTVTCSSLDKGNVVRKNCSVGCIGCGKCSKVCPVGAVKMNGTLAGIDYSLCTNCGECRKECPTKAINQFRCRV